MTQPQLNKSGSKSVTPSGRTMTDHAGSDVAYAEVPGGRIAYEVSGQGPLVVLSP